MKKLISLLLAFTLILTLFGCTQSKDSLEDYNNSNPKEMSFISVKDGYLINENGEKEVSNVYNEPSKRLGSLEEEPPHTNAYQILNVKTKAF